MRELYDRLQPSQENTRKRDRFVQKVQRILETEFPGNLSKVHVFGSSGNMLYTTDSDGKVTLIPAAHSRMLMLLTVDICIQTPMTSLEEMHPLAEALHKRTSCTPKLVQGADTAHRWNGTCSLYTAGQGSDSKSLGSRIGACLRHECEQRSCSREHADDQNLHSDRRPCTTIGHDHQTLDQATSR